VRQWVVDAAATVPPGQAGETMKMAIAQKGLTQLQEVIQESNGDMNAIGGRIRGLGDEYQLLSNQKFAKGPAFVGPFKEDKRSEDERRKNQIEAFRQVYGHDPISQNDWKMAAVLDPTSSTRRTLVFPPMLSSAGSNRFQGRA
jgi:hypothetical protein